MGALSVCLNILDGLVHYLSDILNSLTLKHVNGKLNNKDDMYINQQDAQNSCRIYFPLNALHVSDYISSSSGAIL